MKVVLFLVALSACGLEPSGKDKETIVQQPAPPPVILPPDGGVDFARDIKPRNDQHCALSGCHAGASFLQSEAAFLNSRSKLRIGNGTMPPQYSPRFSQWTQDEKDIYTSYFDSKQ